MAYSALIGLLLAASSPADCPRPTDDAPALCEDRQIAETWAELSAAYDEWLALDGRKATIRLGKERMAALLERGFQPWQGDGGYATPEDAASYLRDETERVRDEIAMARQIAPTGPALFTRECAWTGAGDCRLLSSGMLSSEDGATRIAWQRMRVIQPDQPLRQLVVLYDLTVSDNMLIGHAVTDGMFEEPRLIDDGDEQRLHVPGVLAGTGVRNADILFVKEGGKRWRNIDLDTWWDELPDHLPKGFEIWKGVEYEAGGLFALGSLWSSDDANCCPSGGQVMLDFRIEGDRLKLDAAQRIGPMTGATAETCPIVQASYVFPGDKGWSLRFTKARPQERGGQSDLIARLTGPDVDQRYHIAGSMGLGSASLLPIDDKGQPVEREEDADWLYLHSFDRSADGSLAYRAAPPQSDDQAPDYVFLPDLARALWYDGLPGKAGDSISMPRDAMTLTCRTVD